MLFCHHVLDIIKAPLMRCYINRIQLYCALIWHNPKNHVSINALPVSFSFCHLTDTLPLSTVSVSRIPAISRRPSIIVNVMADTAAHTIDWPLRPYPACPDNDRPSRLTFTSITRQSSFLAQPFLANHNRFFPVVPVIPSVHKTPCIHPVGPGTCNAPA